MAKKKANLEPLFNSFVFLQIPETDLQNVRVSDSIINFAYKLGRPAIVSNEEIEIMKRFLSEYSEVKLEKIPFQLEATANLLDDNQKVNKVQMITVKNNNVKITLRSLGYNILAEVANSNVEIYSNTKPTFNVGENFKFAI